MTEQPKRIQRKHTKGWKMPRGAVYVGRPTKWGNPFNFRRSEFCWAALSYGCRGDRRGRQEASVRAFRSWINPPHGRRTLELEEQPKMGAGKRWSNLGPPVKAGEAPSKDEIKRELRGEDLACWCGLCERHQDGKPFDIECHDCDPCHADVVGELANA